MSLKIGAIPDTNRLKVRQSPTKHMCPIVTRAILSANSSGGKTNLLVSLLTTPHLYGGKVFDAVYVISPSVKLDSTWRHLINYRAKRGQKEEDFFFDHWDESVVQRIMDESAKLTEYHKKNNHQYATSVCLVVDDMADQQHVLHATGNSLLNSLFIRGRHLFHRCW